MPKNSSPATSLEAQRSSRLARLFHSLDAVWARPRADSLEERFARAAMTGCVALALTAFSLFGTAEGPAPLRMAAPLIGLGLVLPLVIALWLTSISPRRARALAQLAAMALVAIGSASFGRATAAPVLLGYLVPALLLLRAGDEVS